MEKKKVGRPQKKDTEKIISITPGLRIEKNKWKLFVEKYPREANKMFNEFVTSMLQK